jgi:hypothetical protein
MRDINIGTTYTTTQPRPLEACIEELRDKYPDASWSAG